MNLEFLDLEFRILSVPEFFFHFKCNKNLTFPWLKNSKNGISNAQKQIPTSNFYLLQAPVGI